jgi:hypothetical protein
VSFWNCLGVIMRSSSGWRWGVRGSPFPKGRRSKAPHYRFKRSNCAQMWLKGDRPRLPSFLALSFSRRAEPNVRSLIWSFDWRGIRRIRMCARSLCLPIVFQVVYLVTSYRRSTAFSHASSISSTFCFLRNSFCVSFDILYLCIKLDPMPET